MTVDKRLSCLPCTVNFDRDDYRMSLCNLASEKKTWFLTTNSLGGNVEIIELSQFPFRLGRKPDLHLSIPRSTVSSQHAEFFERDGQLWIRDLKSTNGTYVNGKPVIGEELLGIGDLIQVADVAFRLASDENALNTNTINNFTVASDQAVSLAQFDRLMSERAVVPHFQPIVAMLDRQLMGYEVLGRSHLPGLEKPKDMFLAASQLNLESELSVMLRMVAMEKALQFPEKPSLYLNTHPAEIVNCGLLDSLIDLRRKFPDQPVTLEVHEAAATSTQLMRELRIALDDLNMQLAYDDFGTGQSRLVELATVCPDVVKFDIKFVRDVHLMPTRQQQMLASLVRMVKELNITALAEGVELEEEHTVLAEMGFELGQGYLYGHPNSQSITMAALNQQALLI
jgi:EAL domain-containing protein (putative c-di-GMP-specific phosphodiesterase class I)